MSTRIRPCPCGEPWSELHIQAAVALTLAQMPAHLDLEESVLLAGARLAGLPNVPAAIMDAEAEGLIVRETITVLRPGPRWDQRGEYARQRLMALAEAHETRHERRTSQALMN